MGNKGSQLSELEFLKCTCIIRRTVITLCIRTRSGRRCQGALRQDPSSVFFASEQTDLLVSAWMHHNPPDNSTWRGKEMQQLLMNDAVFHAGSDHCKQE